MTNRLKNPPNYWLTLEDCNLLFETFKSQLEFSEPIPSFNKRFPNRLESILGSVSQTYDEAYLNPTILEAAAAYFNTFIRSQAFENGNKRLGVLFTHYFLLQNGIDFTLTANELYNLAAFVALAGERGINVDQTKKLCIEIITQFTKEI